jgi:ABC-type sugar transport system substrate-binding protein
MKKFFVFLLVLSLISSITGLATAQTEKSDDLQIGFVIHAIGIPFIQQILDGARAAAEDYGVSLVEAGPQGADPNQQIALVEDVVATGVDGVITSVYADSMIRPVNRIIEQGIPVVLANVGTPKVPAPYVGEASAQSGYVLGKTIIGFLEKQPELSVAILGNCFPGSPSLENRVRGVKTAFEEAGIVELDGPYDVKMDSVENYNRWEQLLAANPQVNAMIGVCAPDITSLGQINKVSGTEFIAGGYDLTEDNLRAVGEGYADVIIGQSPFVQGYLSVAMIVESLREGVALPEEGFYNAGIQIVTKDSVDMAHGLPAISFEKLQELSADPAANREFYQPWIESIQGGKWREALEPMANESAIVKD